jgi:hypothetical protein
VPYLIICLIFEGSSFHSIINDLGETDRLLDHHIPNIGIEGILTIGISHYKDQPTNYHRQIDSGTVVFSHKRQADAALVVNVWVIDLIKAFQFWRIDRVRIRKYQLESDFTIAIWRLFLRVDLDIDSLEGLLIGK